MFDEAEKAKKAYGEQKKQNASADLCKKCGACEKVCPQGLSIRADLEKVAKELNTEEVYFARKPFPMISLELEISINAVGSTRLI